MPSHRSRFAAHFVAVCAGALSVVAALGFDPPVAAWISFALGAVAVLCGLAAFAAPEQGAAARCTEILMVVAGAWTLVSSRSFGGSTLKWLCLGDGVLMWSLGCLGILAHEAIMERRLAHVMTLGQPHREQALRPHGARIRGEAIR